MLYFEWTWDFGVVPGKTNLLASFPSSDIKRLLIKCISFSTRKSGLSYFLSVGNPHIVK